MWEGVKQDQYIKPVLKLSLWYQYIIQPTSIFYLSQEIQRGWISWLLSVDYLCQQWFRKLIVPYLHQYQTFLVKTARSEYTMSYYYQTLGIVPQFVTFAGSLYIEGKEIQNRWLWVVLNDYQMTYQDLLNSFYHATLFMGPYENHCYWNV